MDAPTPNIIGVVNQKGGVGKTTTAVNLATAVAAIGKRALLIDIDPQGNASTGLGIPTEKRVVTIYDVILGMCDAQSAIMKSCVPRLDILPSTVDLSGAEIELVTMDNRNFKLRDALANIETHYDYIFIDCPPSLGLLTLNSLVAASRVVVPLQCEFFALEGLSHLLRTIELIRANLNPTLDIQGIVLTMYDKRNRLTEQVEADVREYLGDKVYKTVIPRNVRISEAPSHGKPAMVYDLQCPGSLAYARLAREFLLQTLAPQPEKQRIPA